MAIAVSDARSNSNDQIAHAANALRSSPRRKKVFTEIYRGKRKAKTVAELMKATKLTQVAVLQDGGKLAGLHIVNQIKIAGKTAYEKDAFYAANKTRVLSLANNPAKLKALPTKYSPKASPGGGPFRVIVQGLKVQITQVTCDDFDQFAKVKGVVSGPAQKISEKAFKDGIQKLIGDTGKFQDWGGEKNDLYTTKLKYKGQRRSIAFAFKGPGMQGTLTPRKLGKSGDQIQRLFLSAAEVFIVQYHSQIDQSVIEQMIAFATLNSVRERKRIWFGVIDGDDTNRLLKAYPRQFGLPK
jgi:hypothetical protein